ncbi:MAG: enoyl-CoA hydratase/isomerase family protein, partial [Phycisphaerales bacterium]|nr:enoyl-CoA hydratase/isomerase family protein [Phycisphaerales bacterium]
AQPFAIDRDGPAISGGFTGCVTIRLEHPGSPVVVLDHPLIQRIEATLKLVAHLSPAPTGLILASASTRVFIAGADLKTIQSPADGPGAGARWDDHQLDRYLAYGQRVFGMLAEMPCPTVAAINGAALGGGLEIAMHCDGLVAAPPPAGGKSYLVGLPEAGLAICPGWGGTNLLPARMNAAEAIRRTAEGKSMNFEEAKASGLFSAVAESADDLIPAAKRWIAAAKNPPRDGAPSRWIGRLDAKARTLSALLEIRGDLPETPSARAVVAAVTAGLEHGWNAALDMERRELVRLRSTPEGRAAIRAFFDKPSVSKKTT